MAVLLATVALNARQPPPPPIAEFAPAAQAQITNAPAELAGDVGSGSGGSGGRGPGGGTTPPGAPDTTTTTGAAGPGRPPRVDLASVRRCVGDPPRQIEDPQSPPCVPFFQGDNGGATSPGVTANEIRVVAPQFAGPIPYITAMERFFNNRFELYGRKLRIIPNLSDFNPAGTTQGELAAAAAAEKERKAFASLDTQFGGYVYRKELARRGIVSIGELEGFSDAEMRSAGPYIWQYPMGVEDELANLGNWVCRRLAGKRAAHSANPLDREATRKFGVVVANNRSSRSEVDLAGFDRELARCGGSAARVKTTTSASMGTLRQAGVTSVICICFISDMTVPPSGAMHSASQQGWFPEWIVSSYQTMDEQIYFKEFAPKEQLSQLFGIRFLPRDVAIRDDPWFWAASEGDPSERWDDPSKSGMQSQRVFYEREYRSLLLLASGIQLAGPRLTPETFAVGLNKAIFPNPDYPTNPGKVSFSGGSHAMTTDGAEHWWSNTARSPYSAEGSGAWCYLDRGRRYVLGAWPTAGDPFFETSCDSGA